MHRRRTAFAALPAALLALAAAAGPPLRAQEPPRSEETFRGEVLVREVGLIVDLPELEVRRRSRTGGLKPEDLLVTEDGIPRPATRVGPVAESSGPAWGVVVYFDHLLATPETRFLAALALSRRAAELTRLGNVAVVVADPEPREVLAATRSAQDLAWKLADYAGEARVQRDRTAREGRPPRTLQDLRRQSDRLLAHLAGRESGGPRALLLAAEGFNLTPREVNRLAAGQGPGGPAGTSAAPVSRETLLPLVTALFEETGRTLSAYGWVTLALPLRKEGLGREHLEPSDLERFRQMANIGAGDGVPPVVPMGGVDPTPLRFDGVIEAFLQLTSAPLLALARATAGTLVAFDQQVEPALQGLSSRWQVYYSTPDPADGKVRAVEVRLQDSAQPLRTRRWVRSSTPETVAEARLRLVLGGDLLEGGLPLTVSGPAAGPATPQIRLSLPARPAQEGEERALLRLSLAYEKADGAVEVRHETIAGAELNQGWSRTVAIQAPTGARRMAVLLEDLGRERWDAEVVNLVDLGGGGTPGR